MHILLQARDVSLPSGDSSVSVMSKPGPRYAKCKKRVKSITSDGRASFISLGDIKTPSPMELTNLSQTVEYNMFHDGKKFT